MDVDDYWELGQAHPLFHIYRRNNMTNIIRDNLYRADYVTTICPFCQINIQDGLNEIGLENVKILNLIQLLKMAYDE